MAAPLRLTRLSGQYPFFLNFFIDHYDHPIIECGVQLADMVYCKKELD